MQRNAQLTESIQRHGAS